MTIYLVEDYSTGEHSAYSTRVAASAKLAQLVADNYSRQFASDWTWRNLTTEQTVDKAKQLFSEYLDDVEKARTEDYVEEIGYIEVLEVDY